MSIQTISANKMVVHFELELERWKTASSLFLITDACVKDLFISKSIAARFSLNNNNNLFNWNIRNKTHFRINWVQLVSFKYHLLNQKCKYTLKWGCSDHWFDMITLGYVGKGHSLWGGVAVTINYWLNLNNDTLLKASDLWTSQLLNNVNKKAHPAPPNKHAKQTRCEPSCFNNDHLIKVRGCPFNHHENRG